MRFNTKDEHCYEAQYDAVVAYLDHRCIMSC